MTEPSVRERYAEVTADIMSRAPESDIDPTLERVRTLLDLLGDPQRSFRVIHVTGTNGKTSTARMIDALVRARGLRVGRYTSPHLRTIRERIVVDGQPISEQAFVEAYEDIQPFVEMADSMNDTPLSFFEILTVMSYAAFADAPVDVAVVEVGMGGRWDATNVVDADVAVLTPISVDHTEYLPDSPEGIAEEKAGIIKPGSIAVMAQQPPPVAEVLMEQAAEIGATVVREGMEFSVASREVAVGGQQVALKGITANYEDIFLPLFGEYQAGNAVLAVASVEAFSAGSGDGPALDPEVVGEALTGTEAPGRLEVVRTSPTIVADAAHNPAGMVATAEAMQEAFSFSRLVGVVAVMAEKDVEGILEPLQPLLDEVVVTRNSSPRSMDPERLALIAEEVFGEDCVHTAPRLDDAIDRAVGLAEDAGDFGGAGVLITGSVVTSGDAVHLLRGSGDEPDERGPTQQTKG